jgi:hypothetical protein
MESWFCTWDDLLRLFAIARVANHKPSKEIKKSNLQILFYGVYDFKFINKKILHL